ncbi:hypothetical protein INT44_005185 [Umbelopsis vinacea]|uniref:Galactosyl transferase GMA12/MNN10 family-domain-containing protein n=1 Tax=Umbelopsis vinacea TaxID=44442 RepID=A0A8H7Q808_9FUNG|nr:hypothetical protein INT44_005185 [Umbelopsis vinacea]
MPSYKPLNVSDPSYGPSTRMRPNRRTVMCLCILALILLLILSAKMTPSEKDDYLTTAPPKEAEVHEPVVSKPDDMADIPDSEDIDENETDQMEDDDITPVLPPSPPKTYPSPHSDSHTKVPAVEDDLEETVINTSNHYQMLVVIATPADQLSRRSLIRQKYFGIHNNLLPCMTANSDIYYRFWVYGGTAKLSGDEHRRYEAERMEYGDIVDMPDVESFDEIAIVNWAEIDLGRKGISYDYMVMQDGNTFVHLQNVKRELLDGVIGEGTDSPTTVSSEMPYNLVWGTFGGGSVDKHAVIVGTSAAKSALLNNNQYEQSDLPLFNRMFKYFSAPSGLDGEANPSGPEFIQEDGEGNNNRMNVWENNIESVHDQDLIITDVYQDSDFEEIARWTSLKPTAACYPAKSSSNATPESSEAIDDDENAEQDVDPDMEEEATLPEEVTPDVSVAVVTSSYIYPDDCMLPSARLAAKNKRQYALNHGYSFVARSTEFAQQAVRGDRKAVWGKIDVIEKVLPKYDWIFWLDMDAVIMNQNTTIESLLAKFESNYQGGKAAFDKNIDFIVAKPHGDPMINAGVFLFRNTPWSMKFLRKVQESTEYYQFHPSYEQMAMWKLMQEPEFKTRSLLLDGDNHTFNTFPNRYHAGDFVVHYAPDKCPNDAVLAGLDAARRIENGEVLQTLE